MIAGFVISISYSTSRTWHVDVATKSSRNEDLCVCSLAFDIRKMNNRSGNRKIPQCDVPDTDTK